MNTDLLAQRLKFLILVKLTAETQNCTGNSCVQGRGSCILLVIPI